MSRRPAVETLVYFAIFAPREIVSLVVDYAWLDLHALKQELLKAKTKTKEKETDEEFIARIDAHQQFAAMEKLGGVAAGHSIFVVTESILELPPWYPLEVAYFRCRMYYAYCKVYNEESDEYETNVAQVQYQPADLKYARALANIDYKQLDDDGVCDALVNNINSDDEIEPCEEEEEDCTVYVYGLVPLVSRN